MPESEPPVLNEALELSLEQASQGDSLAIEQFFRLLLSATLFVPDRYQDIRLSDAPKYPNDFFNFLGVQDKERCLVPIFTNEALIKEWCGQALKFHALKSTQIFERMPESWWICINPGADFEKDLSPWEIDHLRGGESEIPTLCQENTFQAEPEAMSLQAPDVSEFAGLRNKLTEYASDNPHVLKLYILKEITQTDVRNVLNRILIGEQTSAQTSEEVQQIQSDIQSVAQQAQIGAESVTVLAGGGSDDSLMLGAFKNCEAFYQAAPYSQSALKATIKIWQQIKAKLASKD